jgi:hypothetical protein
MIASGLIAVTRNHPGIWSQMVNPHETSSEKSPKAF